MTKNQHFQTFWGIRILAYRYYCKIHRWWLVRVYGMDIGEHVRISRRAVLDYSVNPRGMHIGDNTLIAGNVIVMSHDLLRNIKTDTYIGKNCFIGNASVILPGVKIGNHVVVGAGSIVTKDIPDGCMVVGNPARIVREGIKVSDGSQLVNNGNKV